MPSAPSLRCAAHPSRPAVDRCPVCGRARCGADAAGPACPTCAGHPSGRPPEPVRTGPPPFEQLVRAAAAALLVAAAAGPVCAEYVEAGFLQYALPFGTGVLCGAAGMAVARIKGPQVKDGGFRTGLRVLTGLFAVLGVAFGFVLEGSVDPVTGNVAVPYVLALAGALAWTQPPRARRRDDEPRDDELRDDELRDDEFRDGPAGR